MITLCSPGISSGCVFSGLVLDIYFIIRKSYKGINLEISIRNMGK